MERLETATDLDRAVCRLLAAEPRFGSVVARHGLPPLRHAEPGLACLLRIVTDQLISLKAGAAIWARVHGALGNVSPTAVLALSEADLCGLGLSAAKARCFHAAARAFAGESAGNDDAELSRWLTAIPGIGPWTAEIYLLTAVRSADAWPAADLALQQAASDLFSIPRRPGAREMKELAAPWRPVRSAAALLLWSHYRALKQMPQG